ncbi:MAG: SulP family inorganic anion transporter [Solirubrobacteraceae bacterium]
MFPSLRGYRADWLRGDVVAGLTVWAVLVPESLAYASIAGVSPVVGLYAVPCIDVTAAEMLRRLRDDLERENVRLLLARDIGQVRDVLRQAGTDDAAAVFPSVEEAVSRAR